MTDYTPNLSHRTLWLLALGFFVGGDLVTTGLGLRLGAVESNPVPRLLFNTGGIAAFFAVKLALVSGGTLAYHFIVPTGWRVGIPLGLITVGVIATTWDAVLLA